MNVGLPQLVVSPEAQRDLIDIYQYTRQQWGETQADSYLQEIKNAFINCQRQPLMGAERPELFAMLRFIPVGRHTIYYRFWQHRIEVVRVLHGRQDPKRHI